MAFTIGRIRVDGKEITRSLETTDRHLAKRKLARFKEEQRQIDRTQGKLTLAELCERYFKPFSVRSRKRLNERGASLAELRTIGLLANWLRLLKSDRVMLRRGEQTYLLNLSTRA
jgi:hypothetical protein